MRPATAAKTPSVSVVICSRDGHERVAEAIRSTLMQSLPPHEVIVIDDGSEPSLEKTVLALGDPRINYFRLETSRGLHWARAFGVEKTAGEFVALLDDDDRWLPDKLAEQVHLLAENPEVGLVCSGALDEYPDGVTMSRLPASPRILYSDELVNEYTIASSVVFRRSAYDEVGGFDGSLYRCGDWDCWIRLAAKWEIRAVMKPLVVTAMRAGSLQRSGDIERFAADRWRVVEKHRSELERLGLLGAAKSFHFHSVGVRNLRAGRLREARRDLCRALKAKPRFTTAAAFILALFGVRNDRLFRKTYRSAKRLLLGAIYKSETP